MAVRSVAYRSTLANDVNEAHRFLYATEEYNYILL